MGLLGASLKIKPRRFVWFLKPVNPILDGPSEDTILDGDVVLALSAPKKVTRIDVELIGTQSMLIHGKSVAYPTIQLKTTIDDLGKLEAGSHSFYFSFVVPANTAPGEGLGCNIKNYSLSVNGAKIRASTEHVIRVTARGCGAFGTDLLEECQVIILAITNEDGIPSGYNRVGEPIHPILGPIRGHFFSKYLLVHGFLRAAINIPEVSQDCRILECAVWLEQTIRLRDMSKKTAKDNIPQELTERVILWKASEGPREPLCSGAAEYKNPNIPTRLRKGQGLQLVQIMQLPTDEVMRQTTSMFSDTGIQVSHVLAIVITYCPIGKDGREGEMKELEISFEAQIASCDCTLGSFQLPKYSSAETAPSGFPTSLEDVGCLCMQSAAYNMTEIDKVYGLEDYKDDFGAYKPSIVERRTKWEIEEAQAVARQEIMLGEAD